MVTNQGFFDKLKEAVQNDPEPKAEDGGPQDNDHSRGEPQMSTTSTGNGRGEVSNLPRLPVELIPQATDVSDLRNIVRVKGALNPGQQELWNKAILLWDELALKTRLNLHAGWLRGRQSVGRRVEIEDTAREMWARDARAAQDLSPEQAHMLEMVTNTELTMLHADLMAFGQLTTRDMAEALQRPITPQRRQISFLQRAFGFSEWD